MTEGQPSSGIESTSVFITSSSISTPANEVLPTSVVEPATLAPSPLSAPTLIPSTLISAPTFTPPTLISAPTFSGNAAPPSTTGSPAVIASGESQISLQPSQVPLSTAVPTATENADGVSSNIIVNPKTGDATSLQNSPEIPTSLLATLSASITSNRGDPTAIAVAENQGTDAQSTIAAPNGVGNTGDKIGGTGTGALPTESAGKGSLIVTSKGNNSASTTTIAISVSAVVGM